MQISQFFHGVYYGVYEKYVHAFVSFVLFFIFLIWLAPLYAVLGAFAIGVGKECYDKFVRRTVFDLKDLSANVVGIALAWLLLFLT